MKRFVNLSLPVQLVEYAQDRAGRLRDCLSSALDVGDVDSIHDLRVASRRLYEPLELMTPWLGRGEVRRTQHQLKRIREAYRTVRDLDVLQTSLCSAPASPLLEANDLAQLEGQFTRRRQREFEHTRRPDKRTDPKGAAGVVKRACDRFLKAFRDSEAALIQVIQDRFHSAAAALAAQDPRRLENSDLHPVRISVKRLRYCVEMATRLQVRRDDDLIRELVELQELLGHWNDQMVAARWVSRVARRRRFLISQTAWSARLLEYAAARARSGDEDRARLLERWPRLLLQLELSLGTRPASASVASAPTPV